MYCISEKLQCSKVAYSGGAPCCGVLLLGGDTYFIKDGKIDGNCPLGISGQRDAMRPIFPENEKENSFLTYREEMKIMLDISEEDLIKDKAKVFEKFFCAALCTYKQTTTDIINGVLTEYNKMKNEFYPKKQNEI